MGSNLGRSFACLFVSYQEEKVFQSYQGPILELFKRFVDDGIGATSMPRSDLENFISFVCSFHPALQFEYQISSSYLSFLDIKLQITDNHITTSIGTHRLIFPYPCERNPSPYNPFLERTDVERYLIITLLRQVAWTFLRGFYGN